MNKVGKSWHDEQRRQAQDVYRVHNPTSEDYVVQWGKTDINTPYKIPKAQADIGYGRGNRDVPKYIARKFVKEMTEILLQREAEKEWNAIIKDKNYRPSDYVAKEEERVYSRIAKDRKLREEFEAKCLVGIVSRHGDTLVEPEEISKSKSDTMQRIDDLLDSAPSVEQVESGKKDLLGEV